MRYLDFENSLRLGFTARNPLPPKAIYLSRGRDALYVIAEEILKKGWPPRVLVPAFICEVVPSTFESCGLEPVFYDVDLNLRPDLSDIVKKVIKSKAIVIVNYFGIPQPLEILQKLNYMGLAVVLDDIQALPIFNKPLDCCVAWHISGFRKQLPLPDGAILRGELVKRKECQLKISQQQRKNFFWRLVGLLLRTVIDVFPHHYLEELERDCFTRELRTRRYPTPAPISPLSLYWYCRMDLTSITQRRRQNYSLLLKGLNGVKGVRLFNLDMDTDSSPLGFPLMLEKRDEILNRLQKNKIAAAVLWDGPSMMKERNDFQAQRLWDDILVLPLGQSYNEADMERMVEVIRG